MKAQAQRQARTILLDAHVIATLIDVAIPNLDHGLGGWPTTTPGASPPEQQPPEPCRDIDCTNTRPCTEHDPPDEPGTDTAVERAAAQPDKARADLELLTASIDTAAKHLARAARITQRWGFAGIDTTSIKERLSIIDGGIWCDNCSRYGRHEPRAEERKECVFCSEFRQDWNRPAPREIWDARDARNGRIDQATVIRILAVIDANRKAAPRGRKAG